MTVLEPEGFGQYRICPILPLQPVRGIGDAHEMRGNFRVKMRGHRDARGACDRRRTQPPADAANPHEVGHHVIARSSKYCLVQQAWAMEVLPELNRGLQLACQLSVEAFLDRTIAISETAPDSLESSRTACPAARHLHR